jgi:N-acetylglucosamine-6-sulfatase
MPARARGGSSRLADRLRPATAALAVCVVAAAALAGAAERDAPPDRRPNVIVVLTDDQTFESLPHDPAVMPYLQAQISDPTAGWRWFPNAFVNTPLCCPSRATILTGRYSHHTGVRNNGEGSRLDESSTLATWLRASGYRTALVGKYLNEYPFGRVPYVPPGWDRFVGKENTSDATVYRDYTVVDDGVSRSYGNAPEDYATDVLARDAVGFLRTTPPERPFFLLFAPSAPHRPWLPAPGDAGAYARLAIHDPASVGEADVSDKPAWVRHLPPVSASERAQLRADRRREYETLLAVDDAMRSIDDELRARGELERTIVFYLTDNGFALGEHRWVTKSCPYDPCIRVPFFIRVPGSEGGTDGHLVSNVDLAPTIADIAGVEPGLRQDGLSLAPLLGLDGSPGRDPPAIRRRAILVEFAGGDGIPAWWGIRTRRFLWVDLRTGEHELYDLDGVLGPADPNELHNRADRAAYAGVRRRLERRLESLREG